MFFINKSKDTGSVPYEKPTVNYDTVLDYLVGLSSDDYTKICQVAAIHRQADFEASKVLGTSYEPTTYIVEPKIKLSHLSDAKTSYQDIKKISHNSKGQK